LPAQTGQKDRQAGYAVSNTAQNPVARPRSPPPSRPSTRTTVFPRPNHQPLRFLSLHTVNELVIA